MIRRVPPSRTFESALRSPWKLEPSPSQRAAGREQGKRKDGKPRKLFYQTLMKVSVHHTYYDSSGFLCPDFLFNPTPATAALMKKLGLLFRAEDTGFSVLYDDNRTQTLEQFLRRQAIKTRRGSQVWTRLSFQLSLTNDYFVNLTQIPIDTDPAARNFYFSNLTAQRLSSGLILLNKQDYVSREELLPVMPGQLPVPAWIGHRKLAKVEVRDIANQVVVCVPRCVTEKAVEEKSPSAFTCADEGSYRCADTIYVNFASLREDKYSLVLIDDEGFRLRPRREVLWTSFYPMPLCFIDLLFTSPTGKNPDLYPVRNLWDPPQTQIMTTDYTLMFERRSTLWNYYLVPPRPGSLSDLRIKALPPILASFSKPEKVMLPDGREAFKSSAESPLPLQQQPACNFQLWGKHKDWPHERLLVDRLPAASYQQILPKKEGSVIRNYSDIYVYV